MMLFVVEIGGELSKHTVHVESCGAALCPALGFKRKLCLKSQLKSSPALVEELIKDS